MTDQAVVVDTSVFSAVLSKRTLAAKYAQHLSGRRYVISFQTIAEIRFGAYVAGWSANRIAEMERLLARAAHIPPYDELATVWARLRAELRGVGHGLAAKNHTADLWIAATALALGLPLVTHDHVFLDVPGLAVITELTA